MKKLILLFFICISISALAQKQPESKPVFKVDTGKVVSVTLKFSIQQISNFLQYTTNPAAIDNSKSISTFDANMIRTHTRIIAEYFVNEVNKVIENDRAKFTADTLAKYPPSQPKKKE